MSNIPERTDKYKKGLIDFINYIDRITPVKDLTILEIGAWTGCASEIFAKRFKQVHCIDVWNIDKRCGLTTKYDMKKVEAIFDKRMKQNKNIIKYKGDCLSFVSMFAKVDKKFDIIYVDVYKQFEENLKCWVHYYKLAKKFVSGHDYERRFPGVVRAVNKFFGKPQMVFADTSWIIELQNEGILDDITETIANNPLTINYCKRKE